MSSAVCCLTRWCWVSDCDLSHAGSQRECQTWRRMANRWILEKKLELRPWIRARTRSWVSYQLRWRGGTSVLPGNITDQEWLSRPPVTSETYHWSELAGQTSPSIERILSDLFSKRSQYLNCIDCIEIWKQVWETWLDKTHLKMIGWSGRFLTNRKRLHCCDQINKQSTVG